jgi:hypothetical protein
VKLPLGTPARPFGMPIRPAATPVALLALIVGLAVAAASPAPAAAATPCWKQIINQWLNNQPISTHFKPGCYRQALNNVPEDLRDYSNITDAISAALQASLRPGGGSGGSSGSTGSGDGSGSGNGSSGPVGNPRHLQAAPPQSYYRRAIDNLGTTKADSLPIPLLVLAGLGTALLLSAAGLAAHKRFRARKPQP